MIPDNSFHAHTTPPAACLRCARRARFAEADTVALDRLVRTVADHIAPQIPGLPAGAELAQLVTAASLAVYGSGLFDPHIQALDEPARHTVLVGRVGLVLAFPGAGLTPRDRQ